LCIFCVYLCTSVHILCTSVHVLCTFVHISAHRCTSMLALCRICVHFLHIYGGAARDGGAARGLAKAQRTCAVGKGEGGKGEWGKGKGGRGGGAKRGGGLAMCMACAPCSCAWFPWHPFVHRCRRPPAPPLLSPQVGYLIIELTNGVVRL